jgi:hypothetical protein
VNLSGQVTERVFTPLPHSTEHWDHAVVDHCLTRTRNSGKKTGGEDNDADALRKPAGTSLPSSTKFASIALKRGIPAESSATNALRLAAAVFTSVIRSVALVPFMTSINKKIRNPKSMLLLLLLLMLRLLVAGEDGTIARVGECVGTGDDGADAFKTTTTRKLVIATTPVVGTLAIKPIVLTIADDNLAISAVTLSAMAFELDPAIVTTTATDPAPKVIFLIVLLTSPLKHPTMPCLISSLVWLVICT